MRKTRKDPERRSFLKSLKAQHVISFFGGATFVAGVAIY